VDLEASFLADICRHPRDESLWLILADWLQDQPEPARHLQAELIRLLHRLRTQATAAERPDWHRRADELQKQGVRVPTPTLSNSVGMQLALIPAGLFWMGSPATEAGPSDDEGPVHEVTITRPFFLGVYPVTQGEYQRVMGNNPSHFSASGDGKDKVKKLDTQRFPVESVSWDDAVEFCRRLSELPEERAAGRAYRLPTEAEWEYSCRGGALSYQTFHFGDSLSSREANCDGNDPYGQTKKGPHLERPTAVGHYQQPNGFGLFDLHGNVWEWCTDWYGNDYYRSSPPEDPQGPDSGTDRVLRGGSWGFGGRACRSANRGYYAPEDRLLDFGFRVVLVAPVTRHGQGRPV
jgi:uncharacterized protein (TIGR02996 family)